MYNKKLLDHFLHPRNMGELKNPTHEATVGNPVCGDVMKLQLKIKNNKIIDVKFKTLGCAAAIASTSVLTTMIKGKELSEALKITREDIVKELGGMPEQKIHCSVLAQQALKKAVNNN